MPSFIECAISALRRFSGPILIALVLPVAVAAQADVVGVYLTWQRDPLTTMTVNWVDYYEDASANVWFRERGTKAWQKVEGERKRVAPSSLRVGRAELTGLKPGGEYDIAVSSAEEPTKFFGWFRMLPENLDRAIHFVEGGDMFHQREWLDAMNRRAAELDPDFAVLGGDLAYDNGTSATKWVDWVQSWSRFARAKSGRLIPMIVGIGNHEVRGGYKAKLPEDGPYFAALFALPDNRTYHALDFGNYLSFLVLDSGHSQPVAGAQTEWLRAALTRRAQHRFLFPLYHYPAYGSAKRMGDDLPSEGARAVEIRKHWVTLFEEYGVTAVFEHDHHSYKRTHPLWQNQRDDERGLVYLGDGAWGVSTRSVRAPEPWYLAKWEARRHLFHVTLSPDGSSEYKAIDADGVVFDGVRLSRPRTRPGGSR